DGEPAAPGEAQVPRVRDPTVVEPAPEWRGSVEEGEPLRQRAPLGYSPFFQGPFVGDLAPFWELLADPYRGLVEVQWLAQVASGPNHDHVGGGPVQSRFQFPDLTIPVSHGGEQVRQLRVLLERVLEGADGVGSGIH